MFPVFPINMKCMQEINTTIKIKIKIKQHLFYFSVKPAVSVG